MLRKSKLIDQENPKDKNKYHELHEEYSYIVDNCINLNIQERNPERKLEWVHERQNVIISPTKLINVIFYRVQAISKTIEENREAEAQIDQCYQSHI